MIVLIAAAVAAAAACRATGGPRPQIVQPGPPGEASRIVGAEAAADLSAVRYTAADVRFMQRMIGHHAQALEMVALVPSRTAHGPMHLLARRIEVSQADEIEMMQQWLQQRGEPLPDPHAHHAPGAAMPGMLTQEEMSRLAAARGAAFDRLYVELMIKHHEGALVMVDELFDTPGASQDSDVFAFASAVDADQRMEIERMRAMLAGGPE